MKFSIVSRNKKIFQIIHNLQVQLQNRLDVSIDDSNPDFILTYGGDGTILFSERKYPGVPKITIRGSSRGFKCLYKESDLENVLLSIKDKKYNLRKELKLETMFKGIRYLSLNEVQIHNTSPIKAVRFAVHVNGSTLFDNVISDGVVIATPFGSTAYYSSIGGKKFDKGIGIVLNNPYNVKHEPIIFYEDAKICIEILRDDGLLLFDNDDKIIKIKKGDKIKIKASKNTAKFIVI